MPAANEQTIKVLNSLIETTLDSANGYKEAAEHVDDAELKANFAGRAIRRMELTRRLQAEVRSFGGEPEDDQSLVGKAHNKFLALKDAVTGSSVKSVVDEVERGEDFIKGKFQKAADDAELPPEVRQLVSEAYRSVKADHDEISQIKHQLH